MLSEIEAYLIERQQQTLDKATRLIGEYWNWFQFENRRIAEQKGRGETTSNFAQIAPVIEKFTSGKQAVKSYIVWKKFSPTFSKKIGNRKVSLRLHKHSELEPKAPFLQCTWERERALQLEVKLIPLRIELDAIHQAITRIRSGERKIEKRNLNHQGEAA